MFQPEVNQELTIDGVVYRVGEHPSAPGMPYGQEGRAAVVYRLDGEGQRRALKVFRPRFRVPGLVGLARRLEPFAELPGLQVCRRIVLTSQRQSALLREHTDLSYAVLMPWVEGPTWLEVMITARALSPEESLILARALASTLASMEQESLAHCDLSGANLLIPMLAPNYSIERSPIELVDVEQVYGPDMRRPEYVPSGSMGYAHKTADEGLWSAEADRFAGAVLLAEILGWCDERARSAAWGESYFEPRELQHDSARYEVLVAVLRERWGDSVARLFERAWSREILADCPTFDEWVLVLPESVPASVPTRVRPPLAPVQHVAEATRASALPADAYRVEVHTQPIIIEQVEDQQGELDRLFDDGLAAYKRGEWAEARELLSEVARRQPVYERDGQAAGRLLVDTEKRLVASRQPITTPPLPVTPIPKSAAIQTTTKRSFPVVPVVLVLAIMLLAGVALFLSQSNQPGPGVAAGTSTPLATALAVLPTSTSEVTSGPNDVTQTPIPISPENISRLKIMQTFTETDEVHTIAFSPNGRVLAYGGKDRVVRLRSVPDGAELYVLKGHKDTVESIAFSQDGNMIASGSWDHTIKLWSLEDGTLLRTLSGHKESVDSIALSPDGELVASTSSDGTVKIWNVASGKPIGTLEGNEKNVTSLAFSPGGEMLAGGSVDHSVVLWSMPGGKLKGRYRGSQESYVTSVAFSAGGKRLASGSFDGIVQLWDPNDNMKSAGRTFPSESAVIDVAFSPDGLIIATALSDNSVGLWGASDLSGLGTLSGHTDQVWSVAFSPDGYYIASGSLDNTVQLWGVTGP
ncbi:MAG TPA: hypothetical protein VGE45_10070 [Chloroflexia bacterium]